MRNDNFIFVIYGMNKVYAKYEVSLAIRPSIYQFNVTTKQILQKILQQANTTEKYDWREKILNNLKTRYYKPFCSFNSFS